MTTIHDPSTLTPQSVISVNRFVTRLLVQDTESHLRELCLLNEDLRSDSSWPHLKRNLKLAAGNLISSVRRVESFDLSASRPWIVFEHCSGGSLRKRLQNEPLSEPQIRSAAGTVAGVLMELQRLGCLCGTISEETIFFRTPDTLVLDITGLSSLSTSEEAESVESTSSLPAPTSVRTGKPPGRLEASAKQTSEAQKANLLPAPSRQEQSQARSISEFLTLLQSLIRHADQHNVSLSTELRTIVNRLKEQHQAGTLKPASAVQILSGSNTASLNIFERSDSAVSDQSASDQPVSIDEGSLDRTIIAEPKSPASELFMANVQSQRLGRYELVEKIGEGSAGIVYRAIDVLEDRTVAVKVLNPAGVSGPSSLIRFEKEARLLSRINHPCIAAHLDFNNDRGVSYLVVEYLPGGTLSGYVAGLSICGEKEIVRLILDAVRGLAAAHEQGIVHRDIKPENLLLTETGHRLMTRLRDRSVSSFSMTDQTAELQSDDTTPLLKLSDFGLARFEQQTESLAITRDGAILGTPLYMSPEQCRGEVAGPASDVYSLGATLFHLIAGRPPFEGTTNISVINQHCHDPAPSLRSCRPDVSDVLSQIVDRCLSKTPEARYRSAQDLLPDLEHFLAGRPSSIRLHPPAPNAGENVLEFRLSASLKSSPTQLWPFISNTDRVNQSLGLTAVSYTTRIHPERGNELFAETSIAGQQLQWQEHPYEWIEGRRMSVLREFSAGPFHWFMNVVELQPTADGGTEVTQTFRVAPRGWIGTLLARFQLGRRSPPAFRKVYHQIDEYISQSEWRRPDRDAYGKSISMSRRGVSLLSQRLEGLSGARIDPQVIETLRLFLRHGADQEVARIRPLVFAEQYHLDAQQVIHACLLGVREGALVLLWDILCPSCQIPSEIQDTLAALKGHASCPACDLKFELDFSKSVELIFRAHPELRTVETKTYCIGGPAFSAHVVAQIRVATDERFQLELMLPEGDYRIRSVQLPFTIPLRVSRTATVASHEFQLLAPPDHGTVPAFRSGSQVVTLRNNTPRNLQIRIERTAGRERALTAAAAASMAMFRELFPREVLSEGQMVSMANVCLLALDLPNAADRTDSVGDARSYSETRTIMERAETLTRQYGGAIVRSTGDSFLASFESSSAAVETSISFLQESQSGQIAARAAVHRGPVLVTTMNGRLDYFGKTVFELRELLDRCRTGELSISGAAAESSDIIRFTDRLTTLNAETSASGSLRFNYRYRAVVDSGSISDYPQTASSAE